MNNALGFLIGVSFSAVFLIALLVGTNLLFPGVISRSKSTAEESPGRSFLVGLVNELFFGSIMLGFFALSDSSGNQFFLIPGFVILAVLLVGLTLGLGGVVLMAGERMFPGSAPWSQAMRGGFVLTLASLTPILGWFLFFPYIASLGLGALIIGLIRRK